MFLGFRDIFSEVREAIENTVNFGEEKVTLTIAKPFCTPARNIITGALTPYHVKIYDIRERVIPLSIKDFARRMKIEIKTWENLKYGPASIAFLPSSIEARVRVKKKQAAWAEYLMLRTGRLYVPGKYYDKRNQEWAEKHGGEMPPQWDGNTPWIEKGCSAVNQWKEVKQQLTQEQKKENKKRSIWTKRFE